MTQDVFLTLILFIDLGKGLTQLLKYNNKEPDELIRAKQGSVATQQHLLFFVFALSSDTSLHSTRLRLVDTPTLKFRIYQIRILTYLVVLVPLRIPMISNTCI